MTRLYDASSLVDALLEGRIEETYDQRLLDLTFYEVANALWKHRTLREQLGEARLDHLLEILGALEEQVTVEPVDTLDFSGTMTLAHEGSLTFYDAAYIAVAQREALMLVTEDRALADVAQEFVDVSDRDGLA